MPEDNFFKELKRRNVYRVAVTYTIVAWLLLQVVTVVAPIIDAPDWLSKSVLVILVVGFPIALIFAWAYEMSPQGFIRTTSEASKENPFPATKKKPITSNVIIGVLISIVIGQYIYNRFTGQPGESSVESVKSIAVMPFGTLSNSDEQQYFSDGMMAEIINRLFKIKDLTVTSRTTSMKYKNSNLSAKEVAAELGVANILEGDVMIFNDNIRILINLIDGKADTSKWTGEYETDIEEIFNLQGNIAQTVAEKLKIEISPQTKSLLALGETDDPEAWKLLMQARFEEEFTGDVGKAITLLEKAISIDPDFGPAYADLGLSWLIQGSYEGDMEAKDIFEKVDYNLNKALAINPDYPLTYVYLAANHVWNNWDFEAAEKEWQNYYRLNPPGNTGTHHDVGYLDFLNASGRFEEALNVAEEMLNDEPNSSSSWSTAGLTFYFAGYPENAERHYDKALKLFPLRNIISEAARTYLYTGKYGKVIDLLEGDNLESETSRNLGNLAIAYGHTNQMERSKPILEILKSRSDLSPVGSPSFYAAMVLTQMNKIEDAFAYLDLAYQNHEVEMYWLRVEPPFTPLHGDPRWNQLLDKVGFPQ